MSFGRESWKAWEKEKGDQPSTVKWHRWKAHGSVFRKNQSPLWIWITHLLSRRKYLIHNRTLFLSFDCDVAELSSVKSIKLYWFLLEHTIHFVHFSSYKSNPCIHFPGNSFHISKKRVSWLKTGDYHADKPTILRFQKKCHSQLALSSLCLWILAPKSTQCLLIRCHIPHLGVCDGYS